MKKRIIILIIMFIISLITLSNIVVVKADEINIEEPIGDVGENNNEDVEVDTPPLISEEEIDEIILKLDEYMMVKDIVENKIINLGINFIMYIVGLLLSVIFIFKKVKSGEVAIKDICYSLGISKDVLNNISELYTNNKKAIDSLLDIFDESIKEQKMAIKEAVNRTDKAINDNAKIIEVLKLVYLNNEDMVKSGVANKIAEVLKNDSK